MTPAELHTIRTSLGLSQSALAERIGYRDPVSVSRWERGVEPIPPVVALAVQHLACKPRRAKS